MAPGGIAKHFERKYVHRQFPEGAISGQTRPTPGRAKAPPNVSMQRIRMGSAPLLARESESDDLTGAALPRLFEDEIRRGQILRGNSQRFIEGYLGRRAPAALGSGCHFTDFGDDMLRCYRPLLQGAQILPTFMHGRIPTVDEEAGP